MQRDLGRLEPWTGAICGVQGLVLGHNNPMGCSRMGQSPAKLLSGKGPGDAAQEWVKQSQLCSESQMHPAWDQKEWQQHQGRDCSSVLGTAEAEPQILFALPPGKWWDNHLSWQSSKTSWMWLSGGADSVGLMLGLNLKSSFPTFMIL